MQIQLEIELVDGHSESSGVAESPSEPTEEQPVMGDAPFESTEEQPESEDRLVWNRQRPLWYLNFPASGEDAGARKIK